MHDAAIPRSLPVHSSVAVAFHLQKIAGLTRQFDGGGGGRKVAEFLSGSPGTNDGSTLNICMK